MPTTNFQLKWIAGLVADSETATSSDQDLREIPVITRDAFEVLLPLSIVAHISPMSAPHVIQRFSNIQRFVGQTLAPLVSASFKDAIQKQKKLARAQAEAEQQPEVTRSELSVRIAENAGRAEVAKQTAAAAGIKVTADAEAHAARTRAEALGGTDALLRQLSIEALVDIACNAQVPLVPAIQLDAGSSSNSIGGLIGALLATAAAAPLTGNVLAKGGAA